MKINFEKIEDNELVLIITPSDKMDELNMEIVKYFINEKKKVCIYTLFTKPHKVVLNELFKKNVNTQKIFFIDCATPVSRASEIIGTDKVIYCQPQSLTNISIAITTALKSVSSKDGILILDTITTLMLYNEKDQVIKFLHHLAGEIRKNSVKSLIFTLDEESDKKTISEISRFCDASIHLSQLQEE